MIKSTTLSSFFKDESGATAIEYGLIAALVSVAAIGALTAMGGSLNQIFTSVSGTLGSAVTEGSTGDTTGGTTGDTTGGTTGGT